MALAIVAQQGEGHVADINRLREDEWFLQNEVDLLAAARTAREKREREREAQESEGERRRLRALHFMCCPKCGHPMEVVHIENVEVDRCTFCEGIYLDATELEDLFARRDARRGILARLVGL